jgi:hypothetical protein
MMGQAPVELVLDDTSTERWYRYDVRSGRSYCAEVGARPDENRPTVDPLVTVFKADISTNVPGSPNDTAVQEPSGLVHARVCYVADGTGANYLKVTDANAGPHSYVVRVIETTLYSNYYFVGGDYSALTYIRNATDTPVSYTVNWRNTAGGLLASSSGVLAGNTQVALDARSFPAALAAVAGSVELVHDGAPHAIVASTSVISMTTGVNLEQPFRPRQPW